MKRTKKTQSNMELLILIGVVMLVILIVAYYISKPKESIGIRKAEESLSSVAEYSDMVAELDIGNKIPAKIEIPSSVKSIEYDYVSGELIYNVYGGAEGSDLHRKPKAAYTGFHFDTDGDGEVDPGIYDVIFELIDNDVCVYPIGQREKYCACLLVENFDEPLFVNIVDTDYEIQCNDHECGKIEDPGVTPPEPTIGYGDEIHTLASKCVITDRPEEGIKGTVIYTITNWRDEVIYEETAFDTIDEQGTYQLDNVGLVIDNSGPITIRATCYDRCYTVAKINEREELVTSRETQWHVPYGTIKPFLISEDGSRIKDEDISHYHLINPEQGERDHYEQGWVRSEEAFIIRVGYECIGGECINVDAALWHEEYTPS